MSAGEMAVIIIARACQPRPATSVLQLLAKSHQDELKNQHECDSEVR
jgi:hypothetical protein